MSDDYIGIDEPSTIDKKLDVESLTVGANTVLRERVQIAGTGDTDIAPVDASLGLLVNVSDRAARDCGKVDIAAFDASLPAGTNAIGKLAANSGVDIGDVDILSIAAGDNNIGNVDIASIAAGDNNIGNVDLASAIPAGTNNIGDVDVVSQVASGFEHGSNRDVDTTAEQLPSQAAVFGVLVKASIHNTDEVYVGKSDVTADTTDATDGFELGPGESVLVKVNNANLIYVIGGANNQKVFWLAV